MSVMLSEYKMVHELVHTCHSTSGMFGEYKVRVLVIAIKINDMYIGIEILTTYIMRPILVPNLTEINLPSSPLPFCAFLVARES